MTPLVTGRTLDRLWESISSFAGAEAWVAPESLLRTLDVCWEDAAWSFSRLTADGFPFELSFVGTAVSGSAAPGLRWTAEVAGPEMPHDQRLKHAVEWVARFDGQIDVRTEEPLTEVRHLQSRGELRWGAWLGGRHRDGHDRYKIYAEVPRQGSSGGLRMIGFDFDRLVVERYYRAGPRTAAELTGVLEQADLASRADELLDLVSICAGWPVRPELPGANFGISVATDSRGLKVGVALIAFVRLIFGVDALARRSILALADRFGWDMGGYEVATRGLEGKWKGRPMHTMVSWVVAPDEPVRTTIGVRPQT
jgi:hypothetical protein